MKILMVAPYMHHNPTSREKEERNGEEQVTNDTFVTASKASEPILTTTQTQVRDELRFVAATVLSRAVITRSPRTYET